MLIKAEASDYTSGYRAIFHIGMNNNAGSNVPMIRLQFTSDTAFGIVARHSSPEETAEQIGINGLNTGYNVLFVELDYVNRRIRTKLNDAPVVTRTAFPIQRAKCCICVSCSWFGWIPFGIRTGGKNNDVLGQGEGNEYFSGPLSDAEITSVTDWLQSKRFY